MVAEAFITSVRWLPSSAHTSASVKLSVRPGLMTTASQSSRSEYSRPDDPQGAVNGVRDGRFGFHTALEEDPWWQVDLGQVMPIGEIRIYNRIDQEAARARTLIVLVSDDGVAWGCIHRQAGRQFGGST